MALTTAQLQAGAALLQNTGIRVAPALTAATSAYQQLSVIEPIRATITDGAAVLTSETMDQLKTLASSICAALADSVPAGNSSLVPGTAPAGFSGLITTTAAAYLGQGDLSRFAQAMGAAVGYCAITNEFINSSANAEAFQADTFDGVDNMMSGGLTAVTPDTRALSKDLTNLGQLIDLQQIDQLGNPVALLRQLARQGAVTAPLLIELNNQGIAADAVSAMIRSTESVPPVVQKLLYQAMQQVTGNDLTQVLQILAVSTAGIDTMADLLDPAKIFPASYGSLITPTCSGNQPVYTNSSAVNSGLAQDLPVFAMEGYQRLASVIPPDQALANRAISVSLQQITNIKRMDLPSLAQAYGSVETASGLPLVKSQTSPIDSAVTDYYKNALATGSGVNGTIMIADVLGTAAGMGYIDPMVTVTATIQSMSSQGALDTLTEIYQSMLAALAAPAPDAAIQALVLDAQAELAAISVANPAAVAVLNKNFSAMATHMTKEFGYQARAGLVVSTLQPNVTVATQSMVMSLPGYGQDTQKGGAAEFMEALADTSTLGGQSLIAAMREGRTQAALTPLGVGMNNQVSSDPATQPQQATLLSAN
jgi:hypothetical protein